MTTTDPLNRAARAADFRQAAAQHLGRADAHRADAHRSTVDIRLTIDPALLTDLGVAQQTLDRIAELIAAGAVNAASLAVTA